ncbi:DMT family transporter [Tropicimonas sp. IMCC34011]|uniref:DMT family transporter n=1 Tax=Tropicimonas sp. IMCC34011 TaxID=2248759 RepID=UPI000E246094|nr:DMT family transporter [Tropicimonas sp. IMCC34011]
MGLAFAFIWSSSFSSSRIVVTNVPPLTALVIRFMLSGLIAIVIAKAMGQSLRLTPSQWRATIIFGICQNALYLGLNWIAMQRIEASLAAIIASSMPLVVAFFSWVALGKRLPPLGIAGIAAGMAGVILIMGTRMTGAGADTLSVALCVIGVVALAIATMSVSGASSGGNVIAVVGLQMLVGGAALVPFAFLLHGPANWTPVVIASLTYAIFISGVVATIVWVFLVRRIGATRAAVFHFLNPFLGVAIAALLLGERFGWLDVLGVAIIMAGILAVQISSRSPRAPAAEPEPVSRSAG